MKYFSICKNQKQTTIARQFQIKGVSLINNKAVLIKCSPAKVNTGIVFIFNNLSIKANIKNISKSEFHTTQISKNLD